MPLTGCCVIYDALFYSLSSCGPAGSIYSGRGTAAKRKDVVHFPKCASENIYYFFFPIWLEVAGGATCSKKDTAPPSLCSALEMDMNTGRWKGMFMIKRQSEMWKTSSKYTKNVSLCFSCFIFFIRRISTAYLGCNLEDECLRAYWLESFRCISGPQPEMQQKKIYIFFFLFLEDAEPSEYQVSLWCLKLVTRNCDSPWLCGWSLFYPPPPQTFWYFSGTGITLASV